MRILICASEAPLPPTNGFRLMLTALLQELRRRHEVRVLAILSPDQRSDPGTEPGLRLVPRRKTSRAEDAGALLRALVTRRPLTADNLAALLRGPLRDELDSFAPDVVHVSSGRLAALGQALSDRPAVLAALDAWHLNVDARALAAAGLRRRLLRSESDRVRRFIAAEYGRFDRLVVVSDPDRDALRKVDPSLDVDVVPNGVDVDFYAPDPDAARDPNRIVFTGLMSYAPNVLAAEYLAQRIFPRVRATCPDATLVLVGRAPAPRVRALAELDGVAVTGEVPDIRPWLTGSSVYACPMISGTGIKNKLLEAMACGMPCVATPLALQGLRATSERELLVGRTEEELAGALVRVLGDEELANSLGRQARAYVCAEHDWEAVARAYEHVYRAARAEAAGQAPASQLDDASTHSGR
jgi:glycosyltransferase involved in cell wall biosynthesis